MRDIGQQRAGLVAAFERGWPSAAPAGIWRRWSRRGCGSGCRCFPASPAAPAKLRRIGVWGFDVQIEGDVRKRFKRRPAAECRCPAAERVRIPSGEGPAGVGLGQLRGGIGGDRGPAGWSTLSDRRAIQHDDAVFGFLQGDPDGVGAVFQRDRRCGCSRSSAVPPRWATIAGA